MAIEELDIFTDDRSLLCARTMYPPKSDFKKQAEAAGLLDISQEPPHCFILDTYRFGMLYAQPEHVAELVALAEQTRHPHGGGCHHGLLDLWAERVELEQFLAGERDRLWWYQPGTSCTDTEWQKRELWISLEEWLAQK